MTGYRWWTRLLCAGLLWCAFSAVALAQERQGIHIDQLGYAPVAVKRAVTTAQSDTYTLVDVLTGDIVWQGEPEEPRWSDGVQAFVGVVDFSEVTTPGHYVLRGGKAASYPFQIRRDPYGGLVEVTLSMYDLHRCGVAVEAGPWSHGACHTADARVYGGEETRNVQGGWHDAGDFGRYTVPAAKAVGELLLMQVLARPEAQEALAAARWELDWLLTMQDPQSGGVYHKVTTANFATVYAADADQAELILSPISATATADFAAVMAMASRCYQDPGFRARALAAALRAWDWLEDNKDAPNFTNPPGILTGEYGDWGHQDERYWAAAALYAATGERRFLKAALALAPGEPFAWMEVSNFGDMVWALMVLQAEAEPLRNEGLARIRVACERRWQSAAQEPFGPALGDDYGWGSNALVADDALLLCVGHRVLGEDKYLQAAREQVHYLLGRNPLSQCYLTGLGAQPALHPHHSQAILAEETPPGMLVGGPNGHTADAGPPVFPADQAPATCYVDDSDYASINEVAIYWNSSLVTVLSYIQAAAPAGSPARR